MSGVSRKRLGWWSVGLVVVGLLIWQIVTAGAGTPDPTDPTEHLSRFAVVLDSGILVLREGLETILVLAVLTASMRGANRSYRRPLGMGAALALGASVVTWFIAIAITNAVGKGSLDLQAATGLLAIVVLLIVMNWFFHRVYWTGWIAHHNRRGKAIREGAATSSAQKTLFGLALLGFTSVYREGFEVVLFLQNLRLRYGSLMVLQGVALGLVFVAIIGYATFKLQARLPYKKMLVATGILLGVVLLVMVGESVQELQLAGWIGTSPVDANIPGWMGLWFAIFPNVETIVAQLVAAVLVIGSYFLAEEMRVRRPRRPAFRPFRSSAGMESWLARAARMHGERAAIVAPKETLSYAELSARARSAAGALRERGVGPGDRVALALPSAALVPALHGCLLLGAVAVPVDLRLHPDERAARQSGSRLVLNRPVTGEPIDGAYDAAPSDIATLMFTSGTTGRPKPVALSYDNWLWNALGSALALGLDPEERWLCPMPLAHVGGLSIQLRSVIYATTVVLHDRFDTDRALAALMDADARVTLVSLVPTMLWRLLDAGLREPPTLRRVLLGGGPIAPALLERAAAAGVPVSPSFGMTETCSQVATDGFALLGSELRIADDGELLVRGRAVASGALSDDGWLHTGDLGELDDSGRLRVVGRKSDTIVSGGENVSPAEVEAVLLEHPAVTDTAVLGRADPEWGEAVVAQIVLREGASADADDLRAHCADRLAAFKVPKQFEVVARVPRGVTGKLLRRELR